MIASNILVWGLVLILGSIALRRPRGTISKAFQFSAGQGRAMLLRMPMAILLGAFLVEIVPKELMQSAMGHDSGVGGILLASIAGALLPGGPFISFPIAVAFYKAGAGAPQLTALLTGWSIWAFHRTLNYELPMMGPRFLALRLASSFLFPPLAGLACVVAMNWIDLF